MKPNPPKRPLHFLRWFCREDYLEEIEGDLTEVFIKQAEGDPRKAKWKFAWSVMKYFRPAFIKLFRTGYHINPIDMFRHNFLITYRNFLRYKNSYFINLAGLSSGLACTLLIYLWVNDEVHIDKYHEKDAYLYQVFQNLNTGNGMETIEYTPGLLAKTLAEEMPEVEYATTVIPPYWFSGKGVISSADNRIKVTPQYVSKDYFNVFTCPLIEGDKDEVLLDNQAVLLSRSLSIKLFHTTSNVIGKTIRWDHREAFSGEYFITGIFEDAPDNASVKFDILFNYEQFLIRRRGMQDWGNSDPCTYVILKKDTDVELFNLKIADLKKHKTGNKEDGLLAIQHYSSKYLYGHYQLEHGGYGGGRIRYVKLFATVAVFILLIACINFMNLSTARASRRLKEIGIKKAIGAGRKALIYQYLGEAMMITFFSLLIAIALVYFLLPGFNEITAKHLTFQLSADLALALLGIVVLTGLISGSYPALCLSGFNSVTILKGKLLTAFGEMWIRRGLVVFQFTLSIILIVSVLVIYKQVEFIQSKNLGYDRHDIILFEMEDQPQERLQTFLSELEKIPGVVNASNFGHNLLGDHGGASEMEWEGKDPTLKIQYANLEVGYRFIETVGIEMAAGQTFSRDISPERQIIFNEEAIEKMGIKDPVGKMVKFWGEEKQIVGVTKNFNFESLHEKVKPAFFQVYPESENIMVKAQAGSAKTIIHALEKLYHQFSPGLTFDYKFLDSDYQALYATERRVGILSLYFAVIAILISCLGLFGLAAFTAERRIKEIGIRKVLGATSASIVGLLSADFIKMVLVAIVTSLPVSYLIGLRWLQSFAYRIELEWWFFIGSGLIALVIGWLTIGIQTVKAASANPVNSLKSE
jgi:putative ABC transport system permease protein